MFVMLDKRAEMRIFHPARRAKYRACQKAVFNAAAVLAGRLRGWTKAGYRPCCPADNAKVFIRETNPRSVRQRAVGPVQR